MRDPSGSWRQQSAHAGAVRVTAMPDRPGASPRTPGALRTAVVWEAVRGVLDDRAGDVLDVLDVGGGTGGFAVPLADLGHRVTVVDPSPDALASLERRAGDVGVTVRAVQGDAAALADVAEPGSVDLVLCHGVLEHVDDVAPALTALVAVLRPGGVLSLLAANRNAVVLARAISGRFDQARHALDDPLGRFGPGDPLPRRFTAAELVALMEGQGLTVRALHGVRSFADLVPGALVDAEPGAADALLALERAAANHEAFRAIATQLHVLATRPAGS
jgi:S-adenosylmethionine-dependent methyltransferase